MQANQREMICIVCPAGCHMTVTVADGHAVSVTGNKCKRGDAYACEEVLEPKRVVTAVVKTTSARIPYVPVRTTAPVPKDRIKALLKQLYTLRIEVPIRTLDTVLGNALGTGVDVVSTRSIGANPAD